MSKSKTAARLFLDFLKFGLFTFGGGWGIIAQMDRQYVQQEKSISGEELTDITSVGRSLPGTMIGNIAMLFGYHKAGLLGGFACVLGLIIPPFVVLTVVAFAYTAIRDNAIIAAAMTGIRAAVVPIILCSAFSMVKTSFKFPPCILVAVLTFALYLFLNVGCIWLIVIGVFCGLAITEFYERRGRRNGSD